MKQDYSKGVLEVEGRKFQIEFWIDEYLSLPYFSVSEIVKKPMRVGFFKRRTEIKECLIPISEGWTCEDRLEVAKSKILSHIEHEKFVEVEKQRIAAFCAGSQL